jgi:hypothetical protein
MNCYSFEQGDLYNILEKKLAFPRGLGIGNQGDTI